MNREELNDNELESVVGGLINFNASTNVLTYYDESGSKHTYKILDYDNAWSYCHRCNQANKTEDYIISGLKSRGYIG